MMYGVGAILVGTVLTGCCIAGCCWRRKRMSQPVQPITDAGLLLEDGSAKSSARGLALQALTLPTMPRIGWFKWSKDTDPVAVSEDKQNTRRIRSKRFPNQAPGSSRHSG